MATTTRETRIHVDDHLPAVHIIREFDATPTKVFRAHADPELFARWVGPSASTTRVDHLDCRTGGSYRYASLFEGEEYGFFGSFHDVRPGELIVQTFTYEGEPDSVSLERLELEDLGDGRTRLTATSHFNSFEARDGMVASGMEVGVQDGYAKLDDLLVEFDSD